MEQSSSLVIHRKTLKETDGIIISSILMRSKSVLFVLVSMSLLLVTFHPEMKLASGEDQHDLKVTLVALSPPRPLHHLSSGNSTISNATVKNIGNVTES